MYKKESKYDPDVGLQIYLDLLLLRSIFYGLDRRVSRELDDVCDHERCGGWATPLGSVFMLLSEQWTRLQSRKSGQI